MNIYDKDSQQVLSLSNLTSKSANYLVKYDNTGTPLWAAKMGGLGTNLGDVQTGGFGVAARGSSIYIAFIVKYNVNSNQSIQFYHATDQTTPALNTSISPLFANSGKYVLFLAKYNSNGEFQWMNYCIQTTANGSLDPTAINNLMMKRLTIYADSLNNVYIGFYFNEALQINTNPTLTNTFVGIATYEGSPSSDGILIKYSSAGVYQWYLDMGANSVPDGQYYSVPTGIVCDSLNNVYIGIINYANYPLDFFPSSSSSGSVLTLPNNPNASYYNALVKINSAGEVQWGTVIYGGNASGKYPLIVDSSDNVYGSVMFGLVSLEIYNQNSFTTPAITSPESTDSYDIALVKFSPSGTAIWATYMMGSGVDSQPVVTINSEDKITVAGKTDSDSIDIYDELGGGEGPIQTLTLVSGGTKVFFSQFNTLGIFQKAAHFGKVSEGWLQVRHDIQTSSGDNIYITFPLVIGQTMDAYDSTNTAVLNFTNPVEQDIMILLKYNNDFVPQWIAYNTSTIGTDKGMALISTSSV
jgi:hypothetical protein